jgi:hypothetical protein
MRLRRAAILATTIVAGAVALAIATAGSASASGNAWGCVETYCTLASFDGGFAIGTAPDNAGMYAKTVGSNGVPGGELLNGGMTGYCAFGQNPGDWSAFNSNGTASCSGYGPTYSDSQFIAGGGNDYWGNPSNPDDGYPLTYNASCGAGGNCYSGSCPEYLNFLPFSPSAHAGTLVRYASGHTLALRYQALYTDEYTGSTFYMVRDESVGHGAGDWVFVSSGSCTLHPPAANQLAITNPAASGRTNTDSPYGGPATSSDG